MCILFYSFTLIAPAKLSNSQTSLQVFKSEPEPPAVGLHRLSNHPRSHLNFCGRGPVLFDWVCCDVIKQVGAHFCQHEWRRQLATGVEMMLVGCVWYLNVGRSSGFLLVTGLCTPLDCGAQHTPGNHNKTRKQQTQQGWQHLGRRCGRPSIQIWRRIGTAAR